MNQTEGQVLIDAATQSDQLKQDSADKLEGQRTHENSTEAKKESERSKGRKRLLVNAMHTKIEKFVVEGHPFTQLSDHFGISTKIELVGGR